MAHSLNAALIARGDFSSGPTELKVEKVAAAMRYRFDLHVHTFFSADAASSPEELIAAARRRGLHGFAVTDHNTCQAVDYLLDHGLMRSDGTAVDEFLVVPGVEVSTADGHLLCIGATLPDLIGVPAVDVERAIFDAGGIAIPAHPYDRWRAGIREQVLDQLRTSVIEGFNAAVTSRNYNRLAEEYAARRGLKTIAASDAHHASAIGTATTIYDLPSLSTAALLAALPKGGELDGRYLSRAEGLKKHFGNWFRVFNPAPKRK
jgi:predicted metal-dependent phosphoesterase TrpH